MFTIERIPFIKRKHSSHSTFLIKNSPHVTGPCWCYCWRILYNCTHPGVYTHKQVLIYHILSPSCLDKNWQRVSAFHPPPPVPGSTRAAGTLRSSVHCCRWEGGGGVHSLIAPFLASLMLTFGQSEKCKFHTPCG